MTDGGGNELSRMRLVASEGADDMELSLILNEDGMEPLNIKIMAASEDEMSLAFMLKDTESGKTIADVDLSSTPTASSAEIHIYNTEAGVGSAAEFLTIVASDTSTAMSFTMTLKDPGNEVVGNTLATASATATKSGDDVDCEFEVMVHEMDITLSGTYDITGSSTETTSMSFQATVVESGAEGGTHVDVSASGTNSGDDYDLDVMVMAGDMNISLSGAETTSESGTMSMALQVIANISDDEGEVETFVNVSASGSESGNDYDMTFSSKIGDIMVDGTVVDQYGTQDGLQVDAMYSEGDAVMMIVDVDGTHSGERVDAVAKLLDGDSQELFKLDPLSLTYMSTCYSVHATVFADDDSTMTEIITVGLELTNDSNEVHFDMLSLEGDMDIHMNVSFAEPMEGMEEVPCMQGSCAMNLSHQGPSMEFNFSSSDKDGMEDYMVMNLMTMEDTLFEEWVSVTIEGVQLIDAHTRMESTASADVFDIETDTVDVVSTGTMKESEPEKVVLSWDVALHESSTSQTIVVSVNGSDDESIIKMDIAMMEGDTTMSSMGEINASSERIVKWSLMEEEVGSTTKVDFDVYDSDGLMGTADVEMVDQTGMMTMSANVSAKVDDAVEPLFGITYEKMDSDGIMTEHANISIMDDDGFMPFGGVWLQTKDLTSPQDMMSAELKLLNGEMLQEFAHLLAGVNFTSSDSVRLISDFSAGVTVNVLNPEDYSHLMMINSSATSSGGVFTMAIGMYSSSMEEIMSQDMSGTSDSDSIDLSVTMEDMNAAMTVSFMKPDGRLDLMTPMQSSISLSIEDMSVDFNMGYEGADMWSMSLEVADGGDPVVEVQGQTTGEWFSIMSWASDDTMDMVPGSEDTIGTGFVYEYLNVSLVSVQISEDMKSMWELNYIKTGDYIESTNMSWNTSVSSDEESMSVSSYVMYKDETTGVWHYYNSLNMSTVTIDAAGVTVETMSVSSSFYTTVPADQADDFVNDPVVKQSFVTSIAERVGLPESSLEVTLSVVSGTTRSTATIIKVGYTITTQVAEVSTGAGIIGATAFEAIMATLEETTAEDFVADFVEALEEVEGAVSYSVQAVPNSTGTLKTGDSTPSPPYACLSIGWCDPIPGAYTHGTIEDCASYAAQYTGAVGFAYEVGRDPPCFLLDQSDLDCAIDSQNDNSGGTRSVCYLGTTTTTTTTTPESGEDTASARPTTLWQLVLPGVFGLSLLLS
jgi:hypothetical protein